MEDGGQRGASTNEDLLHLGYFITIRTVIDQDITCGLPQVPTARTEALSAETTLSHSVDARSMSFFGFEQSSDLESEKRRFLEGGLSGANQEDVAVYTWGEESYDGLGDALQEGGDELNDETFGATENIGECNRPTALRSYLDINWTGKDFDFSGTALPEHEKPAPSQFAHVQAEPLQRHLSPASQKAQAPPSHVEPCMVPLAVSLSQSSYSVCSPFFSAGRNLGQQVAILRSTSKQWLQ